MLPHDSSYFLVLVKFRAEWQLLYSFQTCSKTFVAPDHLYNGNRLRATSAQGKVLGPFSPWPQNPQSCIPRAQDGFGWPRTIRTMVISQTKSRLSHGESDPLTFSVYLHWPRKRAEPFHRLGRPTTFLSGESGFLQHNWHEMPKLLAYTLASSAEASWSE